MRDREITVAGLYFEAPGAVPWDDDALIPVPLQLVNIQSDVKNFVGQVDMIQKYQNKENHQIEVVYNFPLEVLKSDPKKLYIGSVTAKKYWNRNEWLQISLNFQKAKPKYK